MHYGLGDPLACLADCKAALALQGQDKDPAILVLAALSCVSLGTYRQAVVYFDLALGTWHRRGCCCMWLCSLREKSVSRCRVMPSPYHIINPH